MSENKIPETSRKSKETTSKDTYVIFVNLMIISRVLKKIISMKMIIERLSSYT